MTETKLDTRSKITPKESSLSQDDKNALENARNSGDKLALLDTLVVEGKFSDQPFASTQAINNEIDLTPNELVVAALSNTNSPEIQISKNLSPEKRVDLVEKTIQARPDLNLKEIRATCRLLQVDSGPFIEKYSTQQTQQVRDAVESGSRNRNLQRIIQTIRYLPEEDISIVQQRYKGQYGTTIEQDSCKIFRRPGDRLAIEIALLGKPQSRSEEYERMRAQVEYEERIRERYRMLPPRPMTDSLKKARKNLDEIKLVIERELELSDEENENVIILFNSLSDQLQNHRDEVTFLGCWPEIWLGLMLLLLTEIILYIFGGKELAIAAPIAICIWVITSGLLWHLRSIRIQQNISSKFDNRKLPPNYTRARAKAEGIKRA